MKKEERIQKEKQHWLEMSCYEKDLWQKGFAYVAGFDEVGRGPMAGPVVAAAVILPTDCEILGLDDSKKLSEAKRTKLALEIKEKAISYGIAEISHRKIDEINILQASILAMEKAYQQLNPEPDFLLTDAVHLSHLPKPQWNIMQGDSKSISIAAASILAKTYRDCLMVDFDKKYPQYGFAQNKGYPTKMHKEAILKYGRCPIHRLSFHMKEEG